MAPVNDRRWRKSSYSGSNGGQCVEVSLAPDLVRIRDSKYTGPADSQPIMSVSVAIWADVLDSVLSGESGCVGEELAIELRPDGGVILDGQRGLELVFTAGEWDAFVKGVADGQFQAPSA